MMVDRCGLPLDECTCPDIDARLRELAYDPTAPLTFKWCRTCDKHYARCRCAVPAFYVILGGKEWPMPDGGYRNAAGGRTVPDLERP